jgi:hypothetical protein
MISIQNVTPKQAEILDRIWECDTEDDVLELREAMDPADWDTLDLLIETIAISCIDDQVQSEVDCTQVRKILSKF